MEVAIGWLLTIGAGILLTIAITAWFTPDRQLISVWFGLPQRSVLIGRVRNTKTSEDPALMDADIEWAFKRPLP
jgi:hypothetical protein